MDEKKNIDELIRGKFGEFSAEPPASVWKNIQTEMAARRRKVRMAYIGWISAAAVVVFAMIAGWMLGDHSGSLSPAVVEHQQPASKQKQEFVVAKQAEENEGNTLKENQPDEEIRENAAESRSTRNLFAANKQEAVIPETPATPMERISYRLLESIRSFVASNVKPNGMPAQHQPLKPTEKAGSDELSESDRLLIAANSQALQQARGHEGGWVIGAHVAPGYGGHAAAHSSQYSNNMGYQAEGGDANVGGGVSIQYKTSNRLRLESGLYYSQNGQSSGRSNGLFAMGSNFDYASGTGRIGEEQMFANSVSLRQGSIAMNSEAGVVNITSTPEGALLAASSEVEKATIAPYSPRMANSLRCSIF